jgi:hypothetical protein
MIDRLVGRLKGIFLALGLCAIALLAAASGADAATWWHPPQQLTWYWQLTGTPKIEPVMAIDIDGFGNGAGEVNTLHAIGQRAICYIDVGTAENWRPDYGKFPPSVMGSGNGWPGENWLNVADLSTLEPIMTARFQMCQAAGYDAVEPDNMDGYENSTGFSITAAQQLTYDEWVANEVHSLGMAVFEKNDSDQASTLQPYFDGVIDEQCNQYKGCSAYNSYLSAGKPVLNAEYSGATSFCAADNAAGIMGALYSTSLDGSTYTPCFGPSTTTPIAGLAAAPPPAASPAPPGRPAPAAPRVDRVAARVRVLGRARLIVVRGAVRIRVACPATQSLCAGRLTVRTVDRVSSGRRKAARLALGAKSFTLAGGHRRTLRVKLARRALHRLRRRARVAVVVTIAARDRAGRHATTRRRLTIVL